MQFTFAPMNAADALAILSWRYEGPYAVYNMSDEGSDILAELLDRHSPHYAVRDEQGELIGFFAFGSSALVWDSGEPAIYEENRMVAIGLGLRPDLTSNGLGLAFVEAGLDFARSAFAPAHFRLFVFSWNERAIRVYEHAGFQRVGSYMQQNAYGEREFLEMRREA